MKKRIIKILSAAALGIMVCSFNSFASSGTGTVYVGKNSVMTQAETGITRTGKYSYANVYPLSVFPTGNYEVDNYTKCKSALYHHTKGNIMISSVYTLTEGTTYSMTIKEGYLDQSQFDLCFAGNSPSLEANILYMYDGK